MSVIYEILIGHLPSHHVQAPFVIMSEVGWQGEEKRDQKI